MQQEAFKIYIDSCRNFLEYDFQFCLIYEMVD